MSEVSATNIFKCFLYPRAMEIEFLVSELIEKHFHKDTTYAKLFSGLCYSKITSTILGHEVAERVLEAFYVRAGYILGILFVLLIKKYFVLFYSILFYFILSYLILSYFILFCFILLFSFSFNLILF